MPRAKKQTAGEPAMAPRRQGGSGSAAAAPRADRSDRQREPKLPHERDESASDGTASASAATAPDRERMKQAHDDVVGGQQDTDRGPVADRTYHALRKKT